MDKVSVVARLIIAAAVGLSGCATQYSTAVSPRNANHVPQERLHLVEFKDANATITIVRDLSEAGSACYWGVFIEDQLIARLGVTEKVDVHVKAGPLKLATARDPMGRGLCGTALGRFELVRGTVLQAGESKVFRLVTLGTGSLEIVRDDQ